MASSLSRATLLSLAAFVVAAGLDYAFGTTMSWMLPPESYGALGVAATWFLLLSFFVASGFPMALAKFLSEDERPQPGLVRFALRANLVVSLVVVALFLGLTFYGPLSPGPGYGRLVWIIGLALVLLSVGGTLQFALQGRMAFSSFALLHASKSLNKLAIGVALVAMGFGVMGALAGLVVGGVVLLIFSWIALRIHAPDALAPGTLAPEERRRFLRYTLSVFAGSFALTLLMSLDLLGLKYLVPAVGSDLVAARYQAATLLTKAPLWGVLAGMSVLFPLMSRLSRRDPRAAAKLLRQVLRWMAIAMAPMILMMTVFPSRVLFMMFPGVYADAAPVLIVSAFGMASLALCLVLTRALQATDRAHAPGAYLAVSVALQVALLIALVPRWGAMGAAVATATASAAGALLALGASARTFRLTLKLRDVVAMASSLALMGAIVAALGPQGRLGSLAAVGAALLAYAVSIWMLGLVRPTERRALVSRLLRRAPQADESGGLAGEA